MKLVQKSSAEAADEAWTRLSFFERGLSLPMPTYDTEEIVIHPQFFDVAERMRRASDANILVTTNGYAITPEVARRLADLDPVAVTISLNAVTPEARRRVMGGSFMKGLDGLANLHQAGVRTTVGVVAWPTVSLDEMERTIRHVQAYDIRYVNIVLGGYTQFQPQLTQFPVPEFWRSVIERLVPIRPELRHPLIFQPGIFEEQVTRSRLGDSYVVGTIDGSPAAVADISIGDELIAVGGVEVTSRSHAQSLLGMMRSAEGLRRTDVTVLRGDEVVTVALGRDGAAGYRYGPPENDRFGIYLVGSSPGCAPAARRAHLEPGLGAAGAVAGGGRRGGPATWAGLRVRDAQAVAGPPRGRALARRRRTGPHRVDRPVRRPRARALHGRRGGRMSSLRALWGLMVGSGRRRLAWACGLTGAMAVSGLQVVILATLGAGGDVVAVVVAVTAVLFVASRMASGLFLREMAALAERVETELDTRLMAWAATAPVGRDAGAQAAGAALFSAELAVRSLLTGVALLLLVGAAAVPVVVAAVVSTVIGVRGLRHLDEAMGSASGAMGRAAGWAGTLQAPLLLAEARSSRRFDWALGRWRDTEGDVDRTLSEGDSRAAVPWLAAQAVLAAGAVWSLAAGVERSVDGRSAWVVAGVGGGWRGGARAPGAAPGQFGHHDRRVAPGRPGGVGAARRPRRSRRP